MAEVASAALIKTLLPIFVNLVKESAVFVKNQALKLNAQRSANGLSKVIVDICTVKTMWSKDQGVMIERFYYPSKILQRSNEGIEIPFNKLLRGSCVVEGVVGQGKSILLRHLCGVVVENGMIPIFLELRAISKERKLEDLILNFLDVAGVDGGEYVFSYLASCGRVALLLDGFDEITADCVSSTIFEIESLRKKYDQLGIIVSSRPYNAIHNLPSFKIYYLASLGSEDYEGFLAKLIPDPIKRFNIRQAIVGAPDNIRDVITTPLMLTLLVMVYESESEIPSTLPGFFEKLFGTVFSRHDRLKAGFDRRHHSGLSESKVQKLFDSFCFMLMQAGDGRSINTSQFNRAFDKAIRYTPDCVCELDAFRKDIVDVACLMLEDGFDLVSFLHKSIMEYHAASFIRNSIDEVARKFYERAHYDYLSWEAVLLFLSNIDEFRYGREYVLKEYPSTLIKMRQALGSKKNEDLIDFFNEVFPSLSFSISGQTVTKMSMGKTINNLFTHQISQAMFMVARDAVRSADTKVLYSAIRACPSQEKGMLNISPEILVKYFDTSALWVELVEIEALLTDVVHKYERIVGTELKKHDIFE